MLTGPLAFALVMFGAAAFLYMARKFIEALQVCEQARVDVDDWYEDVDERLAQRQEWDRPNLRSMP